MANTIILKRSAVAAKIPLTTDLALGEIAVNTADGKVYLKKDNGAESIIEVGAVSSVAGRAGDVTLAVADVADAAPLLSPALTGIPTAPTADVGTNTTQLATTAFVLANAGAAGAVTSVAGRTGDVTLTVADITGTWDGGAY